MRLHAVDVAVLFAGVGLPVAADDAKEEAVTKDLQALKGTWTVVSAERDGKRLGDEQIKGVAFTFVGTGRVVISIPALHLTAVVCRLSVGMAPRAAATGELRRSALE